MHERRGGRGCVVVGVWVESVGDEVQEGIAEQAAHCKADEDAEGGVAQQCGIRTSAGVWPALEEKKEEDKGNEADQLQ